MDPLGTTMHIVVWEKAGPEPDSNGLAVFQDTPNTPQTELSNLNSLLACCSLWKLDATRAMTRSLFDTVEKPGQLALPNMFVRGFFVSKGTMEEAIRRSHEIDLTFLGNYDFDERARQSLAANAPMITMAPLLGLEGTVTVMWMPIPEPSELALPVDMMLDIITSVHEWARQLQDEQRLLDTGRITLTFGTSHLEDGSLRSGRKTAGRMVAIGTYGAEGKSLAEAVSESGLNPELYIVDQGRRTVLGCAQGYDVCIGAAFRPPIYDDPRNTLLG